MSTALHAAAALAAILAAFGAIVWVIATLRRGGLRLPGLGLRQTGGGRRLGVEEVCAIDPRRRLLLVRCDGRRILLLTGGPADLVVASNLDATIGSAA